MQRQYVIAERPLSPRDYDVPVGWWGWNWDPPVPMSVVQLLEARNLDARTAALCWLALEAHGSLLIAAEQPHSGKTTTLTAFLDFLPHDTRRVFIRGWSETFDYLRHSEPRKTLLLANELSSHLPVYLWGDNAVRVFASLRKGYALGSTLHADSAAEAIAQLTQEIHVPAADLALVDLLMVMRLYRAPGGGIARRVVSLHRLALLEDGLRAVPLVTWSSRRDEHVHDDEAEGAYLAARRGGNAQEFAWELNRRAALLLALCQKGVRDIPEVRAALAGYRGEPLRTDGRGDPA